MFLLIPMLYLSPSTIFSICLSYFFHPFISFVLPPSLPPSLFFPVPPSLPVSSFPLCLSQCWIVE